MNGVTETENVEGDSGNDDKHEQSPVKKCPGSSKSCSCRGGACNVSLTEDGQVQQARNRTSSLESFVHTYHRVILELAVLFKSDKAFNELTQAIMSFLSNAQMVDPKFIINPVIPHSKEKNISSKGEISSNMTKLGIHIKISGNGNVFNKWKVWTDKGDGGGNGQQTHKQNKKEEFQDPTVYFLMIISYEVEPKEIIECISHERAQMNGVCLQVKELQSIDSKTVVS
jgi:hypothetical protein